MRVCIALVWLVVVGCGGGSDGGGECADGETRACYRGPADTRGVGVCTDGVESCHGGRWSNVCLGDVTPFVEKCNAADDDCNGIVDDAETTGTECTSPDGCTGMRACSNGAVACISPGKNECGLCGGAAVSNLGATCSNDVCGGTLVCSGDNTSAVCNAPQENACELCGGPAIAGLGDPCVAASGCDGALVCNTSGNNTACSCNPFPGQCKENGNLRAVVAPLPGDLVITEVMPSPAAVSDTLGEWFEVRVMRDVDINELQLDRANDSLAPNTISSASCLRVTTGTHLVFARNTDPAVNGGLPAATGRFTFTLVGGTPTAIGDLRLLFEGTVLDAVTWTSSRAGKSLQLDPDATDIASNDSEPNFCDGATPYGAGDTGTPGAANAQCPLIPTPGTCLAGGAPRAIVKPAANALVITEFLANPAGSTDSVREWLELANTSGAAFDLNELTVARTGQTGTKINAASCISIAPGAFGLLARNTDPAQNGALPAVDATFGFALVDSSGDIELRDGTTVLDAIAYTTGAGVSGVARQLDPDSLSAAANDNASSTTWCAATTTYGDGTNKGTPKAANAQCP
jgi:hypothetical protein